MSYIKRNSCLVLWLRFSSAKIGKREDKTEKFHKEESGLFSPKPSSGFLLVSSLVFSKRGNLELLKGCWWEGWAIPPQRSPLPQLYLAVFSLSELSVGDVCEYVNSGIFSSDVLQWEFLNFFSRRLNRGVNVGHTTSGSVYQNHFCSLRSSLWGMDRF